MTKFKSKNSDVIYFQDGTQLSSEHYHNCCESHYLDFSELQDSEFEGLEFDFSNKNFFRKINGYGIELIPVNGHPIRIPGYGWNNGYYSDELILVLYKDGKTIFREDISECQVVTG